MAVWREIEALEFHPAAVATLSHALRSARHGLLADDLSELRYWARVIEDKVNLELRWAEEDAAWAGCSRRRSRPRLAADRQIRRGAVMGRLEAQGGPAEGIGGG